jgi:hypothetical protein
MHAVDHVSSRRMLLGALAFTVAMVMAFVRPGEERGVEITSQATTTTSPVSTSLVGTVPPPPLPTGEAGVVNVHRRTTLAEICADPELRRALESSSVGQLVPMPMCPSTTTSTP